MKMEKLKNWLENATKFYIIHYENSVNKKGELSSQECLDWEKGKQFKKQVAAAIKLYLKIRQSGKMTASQKHQIGELPNCQNLQEKINHNYKSQQVAIN